MKQTFKQRFWKIGKWFAVLFLSMLVFRIAFGYVSTETSYSSDYSSNFFGSLDNMRKNYASEGKLMKKDLGQRADFAISQKYEKTATVKSKTSQFEADAVAIKTRTNEYDGVIQYEQNIGNKGNREIHLMIGIDPEKFDIFYKKVQEIGLIRSMEITKIDKTNEYKQLNAKKASLEKTLFSLNELKSKAGAISDYVSLHDKILEIETQMQELGVELGNFDAENEFCTIKFSLYEGETEKKLSLIKRVKIALEWTIKYYAILVLSILILVFSIFILLLLIDKLKLMTVIKDKINE